MSLPACQERILRGIESALRKGEPRLASRFTIFARLTRDEELDHARVRRRRPRRDSGTPAWASGRPAVRLRAVILVPVLLIMMVSALAFTSTSSARTCAAASHRAAIAAAHWITCATGRAPTHAARTGEAHHGP
jgi:hypothetical protein